jgi:hypothetical protein
MAPDLVEVPFRSFRKGRGKKALAVVSPLFAPFLIAIVAIITTDDFQVPFGFIAGAKAERSDPNKIAAFGDALDDVAMPVLAMDDVIFLRHDGRSESEQNAKG